MQRILNQAVLHARLVCGAACNRRSTRRLVGMAQALAIERFRVTRSDAAVSVCARLPSVHPYIIAGIYAGQCTVQSKAEAPSRRSMFSVLEWLSTIER
ncbi:MAG: hypothetical protein RMK99_09215 [Anaerolineales bacterium]|nr:hypothetical protein [Anaerolineales bacterium]